MINGQIERYLAFGACCLILNCKCHKNPLTHAWSATHLLEQVTLPACVTHAYAETYTLKCDVVRCFLCSVMSTYNYRPAAILVVYLLKLYEGFDQPPHPRQKGKWTLVT